MALSHASIMDMHHRVVTMKEAGRVCLCLWRTLEFHRLGAVAIPVCTPGQGYGTGNDMSTLLSSAR
jgi:hypothetical protein